MKPLLSVAFLALLLIGCETGPPDLGPPEGWQGTEARWWRTGTDTSFAFRDLETLASMGVVTDEPVYVSRQMMATQSDLARERFVRAVKQSLIRLYRNQPEIVDSLFEQSVTPKIREATMGPDVGQQVEAFKRRGYRLIGNLFQEPRAALQPGKDIPVTYPDSLRALQVGGAVRMQVYVDEEGEPHAIKLLESVHPVLDGIAMQVTTQMRWRPAYLMRGGKWKPMASWVRFNLNFTAPPI